MSSPNNPSTATSFIFTTTRGKRCTAILKAIQFSNVRTTTGRDSRLPATTTTSMTSTTAATTSEENPVPINTSASPPPPLEDSLLPSSTSTTSTPAATSIIIFTSTSSPSFFTSSPEAEETSTGLETETSLGASIVKVTASEIVPDDAVATPFASTVANLQPSSANNAVQATETPSIIPTISSVPSTNNSEAAKVAGGVLSGLVVLSLIGLFLWLWRRRRLNKRRSTLLTPLGPSPQTDPNEKAPYIISRRSIGPTPVFVKAKAALGYSVKKIRERISQAFSEPSIRLLSPSNRPQSEGLLNAHSRNPSLVSTNEVGGTRSVKDSISNWWSRLTAHIHISKRLRITRNDGVGQDRYSDPENTSERRTRLKYQPDFLTLIAMDNGDLDREPQGQGQQHLSVTRQDSGSGSRDKVPTTRPPHLDERDNPFRDNNTLSHISAIPAPLAGVATGGHSDNNTLSHISAIPAPLAGVATGGHSDNNPFSDPYPIRNLHSNKVTTISRPPTATTYRAEDRRRRSSRGQSINASTTANPTRQPSTRTYRESIDSFTTHRNKFRSDPFDLERPELLGGVPQTVTSQGISAAAAAGPSVRHPPSAHTRQESLGGSSRYSYLSRVVSLDDEWNDPGPDVGPASLGSGGTGGYGRLRGASVSVGRGERGKSVGRAM